MFGDSLGNVIAPGNYVALDRFAKAHETGKRAASGLLRHDKPFIALVLFYCPCDVDHEYESHKINKNKYSFPDTKC